MPCLSSGSSMCIAVRPLLILLVSTVLFRCFRLTFGPTNWHVCWAADHHRPLFSFVSFSL